jgi:hypothetical protein
MSLSMPPMPLPIPPSASPTPAWPVSVRAPRSCGRVRPASVWPVLLLASLCAVHPGDAAEGAGIGLTAAYFANPTLSGAPALVRTDATLDFAWAGGAPAPGMPSDHFSVRWHGFLETPAPGPCTLIARSDDGVRLWLDGVLVIDAWVARSVAESTWTFTAEAGRRHAVRIEYFERTGQAVVQLLWQLGSGPRQPVPSAHLHPADPLQVVLPHSSPTSPAFVQGLRQAGSPVTARVGFGAMPVPVRQLNSLEFALDIPLRPLLPTPAGISAGDASVMRSIRWTPTVVAGRSAVRLRAGDALLLRPPGIGVMWVEEGYGLLVPRIPVAAIVPLPVRFPRPGDYRVVVNALNGAEVGVLEVTAVGVDFAAPIACEIDYRRRKEVRVLGGTAEEVAFTAADPALLSVSPDSLTTTGAWIHLRPHGRGVPEVLARLGGAHGPIIGSAVVDEFTLVTSFERDGFAFRRDAAGFGHGLYSFRMDPPLPYVDITVDFFVPTITIDGLSRFRVPGSALDADGVWSAPFILSPASDKSCNRLIATQP